MPVKIEKHGSKFSVKTPHGTKAKATTKKKADAQARLLRGVEHGWKPTGSKKVAEAMVANALGEVADTRPAGWERHYIRVTFEDGNTIDTWINGTPETINKYYLGQSFQFGDTDEHPQDKMVKAVKVDFLDDVKEAEEGAVEDGMVPCEIEPHHSAFIVRFENGTDILLQSDWEQAAFAVDCGFPAPENWDGRPSSLQGDWMDYLYNDIHRCPAHYMEGAEPIQIEDKRNPERAWNRESVTAMDLIGLSEAMSPEAKGIKSAILKYFKLRGLRPKFKTYGGKAGFMGVSLFPKLNAAKLHANPHAHLDQAFSAQDRAAALEAVYGPEFRKNGEDPQAGNVRHHSITMKADEWTKFLASVGHPVQNPDPEPESDEEAPPEHEAEETPDHEASETPGEEAAEHKKRVAYPELSGDDEDLKAFRHQRTAGPEGEKRVASVQKALRAESIVAKLLGEEDSCPNCGGGLAPLPSNPKKYRYCNKGKCKDLPTVVPTDDEAKDLAAKERYKRYGTHEPKLWPGKKIKESAKTYKCWFKGKIIDLPIQDAETPHPWVKLPDGKQYSLTQTLVKNQDKDRPAHL